ncbi:MAG: tetratricopeptide repeat protein [Planctomycetes bacterium]|nr:tetratricopeptide repeat protein [Planctomycetota bacterium]
MQFRLALVEWLADCSEPQLRQPDRALELAQMGVKFSPQRGDSWRSLGMASYRAGRWQAAVDAYAKAFELQPDHESEFFKLFFGNLAWSIHCEFSVISGLWKCYNFTNVGYARRL